MLSDIEIAQKSTLKPITEIAQMLNITMEDLELYGKYKAKLNLRHIPSHQKNPRSKLILVTAINPTKAGEGKTTVSIGLAQALCCLGKNTTAVLREPSLGPVFGLKGGATGGGYSQILPMEDINLHFTGDLHAITTAHNLIAAALDNHIWQGNRLNITNVTWKRALDMNDRALRNIILSDSNNNAARSFQITAASEIMAILCLAEDPQDLRTRIERTTIAYDHEKKPVTIKQLGITGSICTILKDAVHPNLVQTTENTPVFVHGGPFANIAHGCSSIIATKTALKLSDYVVTEAGFGADLGAEKFFHIKCRIGGLQPNAVVLVATIRALKLHGGADDFMAENPLALEKGLFHLQQHIENLKKFGIPVIVAVNCFDTDTLEEKNQLLSFGNKLEIPIELCSVWSDGGQGGIKLAETVLSHLEEQPSLNHLYRLNASLKEKITVVAKEIYRAKNIVYSEEAKEMIKETDKLSLPFPICVSKTQMSFSDDPSLQGCPKNFDFMVRSIKVASGAGYIVVTAGTIIDMPGLPENPAMNNIDINEQGFITGLS